MTRDQFIERVDGLIQFAEVRAGAYPEGEEEHGLWRRIMMHLMQAKGELPE